MSRESQKETFFYILDSKECFWNRKSEVLAKSKKSTFCKGVSPWFLSKNRAFSYMFFFEQKARKQHFLMFWIEKNALWTKKEKFYKILKNRRFEKGFVHAFCQKRDLFHYMSFFLAKKAKKKHFLIFWIENKVFCTSKVKFSQSRKKTTFCKGISPLFLSKNRTFSRMFFFFEPNKAEKNIFWYSG